MHSTVKAARVAGTIYAFEVVSGSSRRIYVPSVLVVRGDAAETAAKIRANETMFRLAILDD
jgi:hypothetical protein